MTIFDPIESLLFGPGPAHTMEWLHRFDSRTDTGWWLLCHRDSVGDAECAIVVWAQTAESAEEIARLLGLPDPAQLVGGPYLQSAVPEGHRSRLMTIEEVYFLLWAEQCNPNLP